VWLVLRRRLVLSTAVIFDGLVVIYTPYMHITTRPASIADE
jgi:hypothetical protein